MVLFCKVGRKRGVSSYRKNTSVKNKNKTPNCSLHDLHDSVAVHGRGGVSCQPSGGETEEFNGAVSAPSGFLVLRESGAVQSYEITPQDQK